MNLETRLRAVEDRIGRIGNPRDALLVASLARESGFEAELDELFEILGPTFRAAALATVVTFVVAGHWYAPPSSVTGALAFYIGLPYIRTTHPGDSMAKECERVLFEPPGELIKNSKRVRILQRLAQRLLDADGLEPLREEVKIFWLGGTEKWPLPVLDQTESDRIQSLVDLISLENEYPMMVWRDPAGNTQVGPPGRTS